MTAGPVAGVGAVILDDERRLLLVKRGKGAYRDAWAVPGGAVRYGETLHDAVVREVREETALDIEPGAVAWVGETIGPGDPPEWHYVLVDFHARITGGQPRAGDDALAVEWVPVDQVPDRTTTPTMLELLRVL